MFLEYLMKQIHNFEINELDFEGICDMILDVLEPFMSRLVGNKERDSYAHHQTHSQSNNTVMGNKKGFPFM